MALLSCQGDILVLGTELEGRIIDNANGCVIDYNLRLGPVRCTCACRGEVGEHLVDIGCVCTGEARRSICRLARGVRGGVG